MAKSLGSKPFRRIAHAVRSAARRPGGVARGALWFSRGLNQARRMRFGGGDPLPNGRSHNDLEEYFDSVASGPGIWKWRHYFDVYHRHLEKFRGRPVNVVEVGVYSGGSLRMWTEYFGDTCRIFGVDIEEACRAYERENVKIVIGDQSDRGFWRRFTSEVPPIDVVIDDGGHQVDQQVATLEELLPHLRPGGVYICEDIPGKLNEFGMYVCGLSRRLYEPLATASNPDDNARRLVYRASPFQAAIESIHLYPYLVVIEKRAAPVTEFVAPKHGTEWQPFLG